ncbi:MAG: hypothetical protein WAK61_11190 [Leclercia sp.]
MKIVRIIADETIAFESLSADESIKLTHNALELISKFQQGSEEPTAKELGRACCLLLTVAEDFMNVQYWQTVEELYCGVNHKFYKEEIIAIRDYYLEYLLEQPVSLHKQR